MWWIPAVMIGGYVLKKIFDEDSTPPVSAKSTLDRNLLRLENELQASSSASKIAIIGQPGSGKSTLLNKLTKGRCIPAPNVGQQTDATAWHDNLNVNFFHTYKNVQFVDIPGYDTFEHPVESYLKYFPFSGFDQVIFVTNTKIHDSDKRIFDKLTKSELSNLIIVRGHSDGLSDYNGVLADFDKIFKTRSLNLEVVFCSNKTKEGISRLANFCGV